MNLNLSAPLKRDILTWEGRFLYAAGLLAAVLPVFPHTISWTQGALFTTILAGVNAISRRGLKAAAALNGILDVPGVPVVPDAPDPEAVLAEIDQFEKAIAAFQGQPGTPAEQVVVGLAPEPLVAPPVTPQPPPVVT